MVLRIARILHAGYVFSRDGVELAFDPIFETPFSTNAHAFPSIRFDHARLGGTRFDAVFISHHHDDHCSLESLALLDRTTPIHVFSIFEEVRDLIRALGFTDVRALALDVPVHVGPFEVIPRRAVDEDVDSMFHVRVDGLEVLNVVDAWIHPAALEILARHAPWDLVLWPFQTMRELEVLSPSRFPPSPRVIPEELHEPLTALRPKLLVPSSCQFTMEPWSWYARAFFPISYAELSAQLSRLLPSTEVLRLDPGVAIELDGFGARPAPRLEWIEPVGPQDVDYDYDPTLVPPSTAEVARRLADDLGPATPEQLTRVHDYLAHELTERWRTLDPRDDGYFSRPRRWRLSVYDHHGAPTHYDHLVDGATMTRLEHPTEPLAWCTEVPAVKLWGALERGEVLTSMYLRIDDVRFDDAIEAELADVDLLEDPLVRCLFEGIVAGYQRAQLERLTRAR
ncbi:MBL fold metallo-hydrolase [Myxococcota bacterium]|nr:MBL fold metallo-hydrolase [Myxococcota bacterium]